METIKLSVKGLQNPFVNDGMNGDNGIPPKDVLISNYENNNDEISNEIEVNWARGSSLLWQTPKHPLLKVQTETETSPLEVEIIEAEIEDKENIETKIDNKVGNTNLKTKWQSRRRPVFSKKKTVSSAGGKFELAAEKKIELISLQKLVAEKQMKQMEEEHEVKMKIIQLKKEREAQKCKMLEQGKLIFEF